MPEKARLMQIPLTTREQDFVDGIAAQEGVSKIDVAREALALLQRVRELSGSVVLANSHPGGKLVEIGPISILTKFRLPNSPTNPSNTQS